MDAGDLFFAKTTVTGIAGEKAILQAKTIVDGFNIIGCDAINIGAKDFAQGLDFLQELETMSSFPFLSANIVEESTSELVFKEYEIVEREGFRFGIVGLVGSLSNITRGSLTTLNFIQRGKEVLEDLEENSDYQIVLFNGTVEQANTIKDSLTKAEFIFISGDTRNPTRSSGKVESGTLMKKLGKQGKSLGVVTIDIKKVGEPLRDLTSLSNRKKFLTRQLNRYNKKDPKKTLEEIYAKDERMLDRISTMKTELENITEELLVEGNTVRFDFVPMSKNIGDNMLLLSMVNETLAQCDALGPDNTSSNQRNSTKKSGRSPKKTESQTKPGK